MCIRDRFVKAALVFVNPCVCEGLGDQGCANSTIYRATTLFFSENPKFVVLYSKKMGVIVLEHCPFRKTDRQKELQHYSLFSLNWCYSAPFFPL